jgi:hypothetical protein
MARHIDTIKRHVGRAKDVVNILDATNRRRTIAKFAQKHGLIYFKSVNSAASQINVVRGMTSSIDQRDNNVCIGTHDGYDMVFIERTATMSFGDMPSTEHRWHIMQFDLHSHSNLPFVFIGTRQQSRTFYAKLFSTYREVRHVDATLYLTSPKPFQTHYTVIASPAEHVFLTQLLSEPITSTMAKHQQPFAIEMYGDSLYVITEASQATMQSLTKMLHYGLWLAKHIDESIQ